MKRLLLIPILLLVNTACLDSEYAVFRFQTDTNIGTWIYQNLFSDDPDEAADDYAQAALHDPKGKEIEAETPGMKVLRKELVVDGDRLDGVLEFHIDDPGKVGLYKHDRRSPWLWCSTDREETIEATNGTILEELKGCVVWDRKAKLLEVKIRTGTLDGDSVPLLPFHQEQQEK